MRGCPVWPPPEVERLTKLAPKALPATTRREDMLEIVKSTAWPAGEQHGLAQRIDEALSMAKHVSASTCPVNAISAGSHRFIAHYNKRQSFGAGMGGLVPPADVLGDCDVRQIHAFQVIKNETERLIKLEKKAKENK